MAGRGRSNAQLLARAGRIVALLRAHPAGLTTQELREAVHYGPAGKASQMRTLNRDLDFLRRAGWRIDTVMDGHSSARRVLRHVDSRFASMFTAAERAELSRAAACAGPEIAAALFEDLGPSPPGDPPFLLAHQDGYRRLAVCQAAAADRCQLRFDYAGQRRITSPVTVVLSTSWYLRALDHDGGSGQYKTFAIDRMRNLAMGPPGSAEQVDPEAAGPPVIDPMAVRRHAPVEVVLSTDEDNLADVVDALGRGGYTQQPGPEAGSVTLTVPVTNLDALPGRLFELGLRVRLEGPEQVRQRIQAVLSAGVPR